MNIKELHLAAFGPFTDRVLAFDGTAGLHVIYGPNEAGKSSALRGLKALLYGVEERTADHFLHANDKLRIGGCLQNSAGDELTFVRRKGRKHTLLTPAGEPLDDQVLAPFLLGVSRDLFEAFFGIDHQALLRGGQEILQQKGEVGQALFSAALGSHALHTVLQQLDSEAGDLFRPRGSNQTINSALKAYTGLKKDIRECSLSSREWDQHRRALVKTTTELDKTQTELSDLRIEVNRLQRIQRVSPKLARRQDLLQELASCGEVVILSDDFSARYQQAVMTLDIAEVGLSKDAPRFEEFQQQLSSLSMRHAVLQQAEGIEDLHARLGGHRKALKDRPHLDMERQILQADAASLLQTCRPDLELAGAEQLRPLLVRHKSITERGNQHAVRVSRVESAESSQRATQQRLESASRERQALPASGSPEGLRGSITMARKLGDIDGTIQQTRSELKAVQQRCAAELSSLTLWSGALADLPGLAVPGRESIHHFSAAYDELDRRVQRQREKQAAAEENLQQATLHLDEIQRVGVVPTEAELINARAGRDQLWQQMRDQWTGIENAAPALDRTDTLGALPDEFEHRLAAADEVSDRLRREADRVHALASWQARAATERQQLAELSRQMDLCSSDQRSMEAQWQALWASCNILPRTPREMVGWLDALEKLRDRVGQFQQLDRSQQEQEQLRSQQIQRLSRQLQSQGETVDASGLLEPLLLESEAQARRLEDIHQQRDTLDKRLRGLEADLASSTDDHRRAQEGLDQWQAQWAALIHDLGMQGDTSPASMADFIEQVRALFAKQGEAEKLQLRIGAIDKDAELFQDQVARMVTRIAPELANLSTNDAVLRLNVLLSDNRSTETRQRQIEQQLEQLGQDIQAYHATIQTSSTQLATLCEEAGCSEQVPVNTDAGSTGMDAGAHARLKISQQQSQRLVELKATLAATEQEILEAGEGMTLDTLEVETADVDPDGLPGRIDLLQHKINDELEPRRTELAQRKGREAKELELMDGSDRAAVLAEQAQATLASIRSNAERYLRTKLAGRILRDQIERYRKENQGPLVQRASEHFAALTLGSFTGLMTDFNDKDEPILIAVRPDSARVSVEGMSTGSRDQLYLALRLASLEKYRETAEPMPFIVDDILVDFDDQRAAAALAALARLAKKTQVILFSHHRQVIEQVKKLDASVQILGAEKN